MLSPRTPVHEEPDSLVRLRQYRPSVFIETFRRGRRMEPSEFNGQFATAGPFQVNGTARSVVSIGPHPLGHRQMHQVQDRCDRPRNGTRIRAPLADVVQERRFDHLGVTWERRFDSSRDHDRMALIWDTLFPEELRAPCREVVVHVSLFVWAQRPGAEMPEEPED